MSRWLTFDDLCSDLQLKPPQVRRLIKQGKLVGICHGHRSRVSTDWRFLDPADRYKRSLTLLAQMQSKSLSIDISEFPVIAPREFAELCGFSEARVRGLIHRRVLTPHKIGKFSLFTAVQLRDFLLRRDRREYGPARPRMQPLLEWCMRFVDSERGLSISKADVHRDDALEGTLQGLLRLREPQRTAAVKEFWRRYTLAAEIARIAHT